MQLSWLRWRLAASVLLMAHGVRREPCADPLLEDVEAWNEMAAFVRSVGGVVDERLCLDREDGGDGMRSVFAKSKIGVGEEIFQLPSTALLGLSKRSAAGLEAGKFVKRLAVDLGMDIAKYPPIRNGLFALFMQQLIRASQEEPSSTFFDGPWPTRYPISLAFGAYMRILAASLGDNIPVVRAVEGTMDSSMLEGSLVKRRITEQLNGYKTLHNMLMASDKARSRLAFDCPLNEFVRSVALIASRTATGGGTSSFLMTPAMDFMNHHPLFNVNHSARIRNEDKWLVSHTKRDIDAGEELSIDYMNAGMRAVGDSFEQYGFTLPDKHLPQSKALDRCASLITGEENLQVLKEAGSWIPPEDVEGLSQQASYWNLNVWRSRAEEVFCAKQVLDMARDEVKGKQVDDKLEELLSEAPSHEEL